MSDLRTSNEAIKDVENGLYKGQGKHKIVLYGDVKARLEVQDQFAFKLMPMMHTDMDLDVLYMDGKLTMRHFQCLQTRFQIRPETARNFHKSEDRF